MLIVSVKPFCVFVVVEAPTVPPFIPKVRLLESSVVPWNNLNVPPELVYTRTGSDPKKVKEGTEVLSLVKSPLIAAVPVAPVSPLSTLVKDCFFNIVWVPSISIE